MSELPAMHSRLMRARFLLLIVGLACGAAAIPAALDPASPFFRAYLFAYLFWLGISLGSLALIMVHNLTGGRWGTPVRPAAVASSLTLPLMIPLFIPIFLGMHQLYAWSIPGASGEIIQHRAPYLQMPFFLGRTIGYFVVWTALAMLLAHFSRLWIERGNLRAAAVVRRLSALGLVLYLMTVTHASVDWVMSRDIHFYSTTYGFVVATGQAASAMAFMILMARWLGAPRPGPPVKPHTDSVNIDLGNLLLTVVILWAYIAFFQLLVIWMGNTSEDNGWYTERGFGVRNAWSYITLAIAVFHFFVPFFLLLSRKIKDNARSLTAVAGLVLATHLLEQYWMVAPSGGDGRPAFEPHYVDALVPIAIGGVWLFTFLTIYRSRPLPAPVVVHSAVEGGAAHA